MQKLTLKLFQLKTITIGITNCIGSGDDSISPPAHWNLLCFFVCELQTRILLLLLILPAFCKLFLKERTKSLLSFARSDTWDGTITIANFVAL